MCTCPYCNQPAQLVTGTDVYPHRADLASLKFWSCEPCKAWVGCHRAGDFVRDEHGRKVMSDGTLPQGRLANEELRRWKMRAHAAFDPLWKGRHMARNEAYAWLAKHLQMPVAKCHIGMFDVDQCRRVVDLVEEWKVAA